MGELLDLQESLRLMRDKYKSSGWYERKELEKNAEQIKQRIKKQTTQYKIWVKNGLDDYGKTVADALF